MKTNIYLPIIVLLFSVVLFVGFTSPAHAAMASQSRLVSMQTNGADVNYDYSVITTGAPQAASQKLTWPSFMEFMLTMSEMVIGVAGFFLIYLMAISLPIHFRKNRVRMHSHSLVARHRHS